MAIETVYEIERKFLLAEVPADVALGRGVRVCQYYLPGELGEVRAREIEGRYFLCTKSDGGLVREEWEVEMPKSAFELFKARGAERSIEKTRHTIDHDGCALILDVYGGRLEGLVTLECEHTSEEAARAFVLPTWAHGAREVTLDARFKNKALARHGLPTAAEPRAAR